MIDDNKFKVKTVEINDGGTYGKFVCEPLDRGYGITLGNSLRRVLPGIPGWRSNHFD